MTDSIQPNPVPPFTGAPHQMRPKLRPIRGFATQHNEQVLMGLADARQVSDKVVLAVPQFQVVLPHMNGTNDLDAICKAVGRGLDTNVLQQFVAQLDDAGLLEGPVFDALLSKMREQFDSSPTLPPGSSSQVGEMLAGQELGESSTEEQRIALAPKKLREALDQWISQALEKVEDPSFDTLPRAVIAPHLDYWRGWMNYAHVYGRMRVVDAPERIVILGTNHFGSGTGVTACDKGYESPLGTCPLDADFLNLLKAKLGAENAAKLLKDRYDHEREHSVELHIPWVQHVFADKKTGAMPKVVGILVHDPAMNNGESYDNLGLGILPFIEALKQTISESKGKTLIVASADLSHIGQSFGDKTPIMGETPEADAFRQKVLGHDQEMLALVEQGKPEDLVSSMAWQQNPTRWCSVGNLVAMLKVTDAKAVKRLNYAGVGDQQGVAFVTSYAGVVE
jgi:AmmeMemoRadiSam system protein B